MKSLFLVFALLATLARGEIQHTVAKVDVPGEWENDRESNESTLILNSRPAGRQIVVSLSRLKQEAPDLDQIIGAAKKIFELHLLAAQKLSPDVHFDNPEVSTTEATVVCVCRGFAAKQKVRMAIRIEGTARTVRSTSVYDYTGQSAEDFQKWSATILAGVK